ncbi:MAG TPA: SulP family inorganic anion transporter [Angustibacter sp.]|nr:SulP family inorganic anion transporter [Angustibacter sp.]
MTAATRARRLLPSRTDYAGLRHGWTADLLAGVTVAVVALPLALAFGVASGVGAAAGLVTAVVAGAVAAVFGGSHLQVSGPTGAMTVVLVPIVAEQGVGAVAAIAVLAGVVVAAAGVLRLGRLIGLVPWPVVEGFTVGIAVVIAAQQVPMALGVHRPDGENAALVAVRAVGRFATDPSGSVLGLLLLAVVLTVGLPRLHRSLPSGLLAVAAVTAVAELSGTGVARIGAIPRTLAVPSLPDIVSLPGLLPAALVVAALAALESLLSARVADGMTDAARHDPDRELVGQGLANVAAGLFGGLPATGALARTAVNARTGARTRLAALTHALVLVALMALAAPLVGRIPLVALAGVLLVTAYRMVERHVVVAVLRSTRTDAAVFVVTAAATVLLDLVTAVEIGVAVAVVVALVKLSHTSRVVEDDVALEIAPPEEHDLLRRHVLVYRVDGPLFFAASGRFLGQLTDVADVRVVVLRLANLAMLDATGARAVGEIVEELDGRGIAVVLKISSPQHLRLLRTVGALDLLERRGNVRGDLPAAIGLALELAAGPRGRRPEAQLASGSAG